MTLRLKSLIALAALSIAIWAGAIAAARWAYFKYSDERISQRYTASKR